MLAAEMYNFEACALPYLCTRVQGFSKKFTSKGQRES
jgi:hypothetical protein